MLKPGAEIIAGLVGAIIPVALTADMNLRRASVLIFVGLAVSYYMTPLVSHMLRIETEFMPAVGFVVGMVGIKLAQAIIDYADTDRIQKLIANILTGAATRIGGLNGGPSDNKDGQPK